MNKFNAFLNNNKKILVVIVFSFVLYILNKTILINISKGSLNYFLRCYFNDLLCPFIFLGLCKLIFFMANIRFNSYLEYLSLIIIAAIVWEYVIPFVRKESISDILDLMMYMIGANICYFLYEK